MRTHRVPTVGVGTSGYKRSFSVGSIHRVRVNDSINHLQIKTLAAAAMDCGPTVGGD